MRHALALVLLMTSPASAQVTDCDRLAGIPGIPRIDGAPGVYAVTDPGTAAACERAMAAQPGDAFFAVLLARALVAADPDDRRAVSVLADQVQRLPALVAGALGQLYEYGQGGLSASERSARDFYRLSCDYWPSNQAAPGCTGYAVMMIEGRGGPVNERGGFNLLDNLCRGGWGDACTQQAFQTDLRGDGDDAQIAALFEAACTGGDLLGCSQFGFRLELGQGVGLDVSRAADLYRRACDGGEPQGCSYLGEIYRSGLGARPDMAEALRLFDLGCAGNDPYACVTLGDILSEGRGIPRDVPRALIVLDRACTLGDPEACDMADALR